ncbi:MAG: ATP-binding protein [Myxococcota bacterium]|nr:ATP-binding protein [Myxococcota bacterium]
MKPGRRTWGLPTRWDPPRVRRAVVPLLFLALGLAVTIVLWRGFVGERRAQFRAVMSRAAEDGREAVRDQVEGQLEALRRLAALWARFGHRPLEEWRADADMMLSQVPGLWRLAWIDSTRDEVWVASGAEPAALRRVGPGERAEMEELLAGARGPDRPRMEGPFPLGDGSGYRVYVPVHGASGVHGVLAATVDVEATLDPVFADSRLAVLVSWNGVPILRRGLPVDASLPWWEGAEGVVRLSLGPAWSVRHAPTATVYQAILTPLPNYLLYVGAFASFLMAALAYEMQLARSRARTLEVSYRDLDARMSETEEARQALRELNAELERRVDARTAELNEAIAELESFNYSVSHDLRSPLGAIQNLTAILQEDCQDALGESELELLDRVQGSASSAVEMMDGLLELSRMGRAELDVRDTDMEALARDAFAEAAAASDGGEGDFELAELPSARVDPAMMRVVWMNLLRNALKYSRDREKPRIQVGFHREPGATVYFVRDNGVGFDMRFAGKLFRAFERLHGREEFEGTGLGLAVVSRIVRRHGGRVWAEGEPGRGATFSFSVPRTEGGPA